MNSYIDEDDKARLLLNRKEKMVDSLVRNENKISQSNAFIAHIQPIADILVKLIINQSSPNLWNELIFFIKIFRINLKNYLNTILKI